MAKGKRTNADKQARRNRMARLAEMSKLGELKEEWRDLWNKKGKGASISARYELSKSVAYAEERLGYKETIALLKEVVNDHAMTICVAWMATTMKPGLVERACRLAENGSMSWTHLKEIMWIDQKEQEGLIDRCVEKKLTATELRGVLASEYEWERTSKRPIRVKQLVTAYRRHLSNLNGVMDKMLATNDGKSFMDAVPSVKKNDRRKAIAELKTAKKLLQRWQKRREKLAACLEEAQKKLEELEKSGEVTASTGSSGR